MKSITVYSSVDFRSWLKKHHSNESKVEVILYKKHTRKPAPSHRELIEEAICFGWIDTTIKRLDENRFIRYFSRRNKNSKWSDNTLGYARQLTKDGRMTPEGMKAYKAGSKKPVHDHDIPKNPSMPPEIKKALSKNKKVKENFDKIPPSTRRMFYRWYLSAKREETKAKRLKKIIELSKTDSKEIY